MREAKRGDMALIVGCRKNVSMNGKLVEVLSDPINAERDQMMGRGILDGEQWECKNTSPCRLSKYGMPGRQWWIPTRHLIPILPPDEASRLFASEPVDGKVKA